MSSPAVSRHRTPARAAHPATGLRPPAPRNGAAAAPPAARLIGRFRYDPGSGAWWWSPEMFALYGLAPGGAEPSTDALLRHLEKDLGSVALPRLPLEPQPFTIAEYFPDGSVTGFHDPRQHAISLAFVVACDGDCAPSQDALDLAWVTPEEAVSPGVRAEMAGGHDRLVRLALGHVGQLP